MQSRWSSLNSQLSWEVAVQIRSSTLDISARRCFLKKRGLNYQLVHFYNLVKPNFPAAAPNALTSQSFSLLGAATKKETMQAAAVMPTETHNAGA